MSDAETQRLIGGLTSSIDHLKESISDMREQWQRQEETAVAGRRLLHEKFEAYRMENTAQIASLGIRVDRVVDTMKDVEPAVQSFRDEKLRQEGAKRLGAWLWGASVAIAGAIGWGLTQYFGLIKYFKP